MGFINEYSSKVVHDSKAISLFQRYNEKNHPEITYEYKKEFRFFKRAMATVQLDELGVNVEILTPPHLEYTKPSFSEELGLLNSAINQEAKHRTNKFLSIIKKLAKK